MPLSGRASDFFQEMAKKRIQEYENQILALQELPKEEQLKKVNLYLNGLLPQYDAITYNQEERWATPKEFLSFGHGDCEDYSIIKYYSLLRLGFDAQRLYLLIVREKYRGSKHMVMAYFDKQNRAPLILDNLSFRILRLDKRVDLEAELLVNTSGVYEFSEGFKLKKIAKRYKEFEELEMKVKSDL